MKLEKINNLVRELLIELGEDPDREGLKDTPKRYAEMMAFLTSGYRTDLSQATNGSFFTHRLGNMVVLKDIELYSLCGSGFWSEQAGAYRGHVLP